MRLISPSRFGVLGLTLLVAAGCGRSGPELAAVQGQVTLDGQPVPGASITFKPQGMEGSPSYGLSDNSGHYYLMYTRDAKGARLGTYEVTITSSGKLSKSEIAELKANGEEVPPEPVELPKKYGQPGALTAEVKPKSNTINFELTSK